MNSPALKKYEVAQPTLLMNSSVSIEEHLRSKSRTITAVNMLKFFMRMVMVQNAMAILMQIFVLEPHPIVFMHMNDDDDGVIWNHEQNINLYLSCTVLFGFYWSLSDWFYYDRDHELVSWNGVFKVFGIDLVTNWIKFIGEIGNCVLFLLGCALIAVPLTVFIALRLILCPCFFGYNREGILCCNLFTNIMEFNLKLIKKCYV